ncbi:MAG: DUF6647 family protein [Paracoccaceae bacterium]
MLLRSLIMALFAATALPAPCTAEGRAVPDPLVVAIAAWVADATDLPMPRTLPEIRFAAPEDMGLLMRASAHSPTGDSALEIVAFYDTPARAIYLPSGWTGATPGELSVLVHEMVHHAQAEAGRRFACPAERERQAYDAQARWLALFGSDLSREFGIDRLFLLLATTCGMP